VASFGRMQVGAELVQAGQVCRSVCPFFLWMEAGCEPGRAKHCDNTMNVVLCSRRAH
jgi:hypothetical protein